MMFNAAFVRPRKSRISDLPRRKYHSCVRPSGNSQSELGECGTYPSSSHLVIPTSEVIRTQFPTLIKHVLHKFPVDISQYTRTHTSGTSQGPTSDFLFPRISDTQSKPASCCQHYTCSQHYTPYRPPSGLDLFRLQIYFHQRYIHSD